MKVVSRHSYIPVDGGCSGYNIKSTSGCGYGYGLGSGGGAGNGSGRGCGWADGESYDSGEGWGHGTSCGGGFDMDECSPQRWMDTSDPRYTRKWHKLVGGEPIYVVI